MRGITNFADLSRLRRIFRAAREAAIRMPSPFYAHALERMPGRCEVLEGGSSKETENSDTEGENRRGNESGIRPLIHKAQHGPLQAGGWYLRAILSVVHQGPLGTLWVAYRRKNRERPSQGDRARERRRGLAGPFVDGAGGAGSTVPGRRSGKQRGTRIATLTKRE